MKQDDLKLDLPEPEKRCLVLRPQNTEVGYLYVGGDNKVSARRAREALDNGKSVEVPNARSMSYGKFFAGIMQYEDIKVIEWSSSAGDWTFGVKDGDFWYVAGQSNRYPRHGFSYYVNRDVGAESFEDLCRL